MQQLEIDENKNPNDAASMTMKSERLRPPIASKGFNSLNNLLGQEVRPSINQQKSSHELYSVTQDDNSTSMSNPL